MYICIHVQLICHMCISHAKYMVFPYLCLRSSASYLGGGGGRIKVFGCDELCRGSRSDEMRSETALYLCARLAVLVKGGTGGGGGGGLRGDWGV